MTKVEAIDYLDNYRKMYADLAPEKFLKALDILLSESELPGNLDEAMDKNFETMEVLDHENIFEIYSSPGQCGWQDKEKPTRPKLLSRFLLVGLNGSDVLRYGSMTNFKQKEIR